VELFDQHSVSFVSITQSFNTTTSMGRLTLNVLLSFAQFEREVIGERVRDTCWHRQRSLLPERGRRADAGQEEPSAAGAAVFQAIAR
jgi:DNA invertase Pin-like site-specific DNA recombinase